MLAALALLLTAFGPLAAAIGDPGVGQTALPASDGRDTRLMDDDDVEREVIPMSEADNVFSAKFEGDAVEGTASNQDGKYVIEAVKTDGEAWHIKLECNYQTVPGRDYFVTYQFSSTTAGLVKFGDQQEFRIVRGDNAVTGILTAVSDLTYLDLQLGALAPFTAEFTGVIVEELEDVAEFEEIMDPSFRLDADGTAAEQHDLYHVSLEKEAEAATFRILQAPAVRNPWNVKLFVQTGFTPEPGKNYRITYDLEAARPQSTFETSFDGNTEAAYGMQSQTLKSGKQTVTGIIQGGKGPLTIQIRPGKTNGTDGNVYRVSNVKIEAVTLVAKKHYNYAPAVTLWTHEDYKSALTKQEDRAEVRIEQTPDEGMEPWKTKLFIDTGITLKAGEKYRISLDVCAEEETAFEICYNRGGEEKGLGAQYGLTAYTDTRTYEYTAYAIRDTHLVIQVSLGGCAAPNTFTVSHVKVEQAGEIEKISEREYTFGQYARSGCRSISRAAPINPITHVLPDGEPGRTASGQNEPSICAG